MEVTEAQVVANCMDVLGVYGIFAWRNNTGALQNKSGRLVHYGLTGSADIIGILPSGRFLAIECKRPKGGRVSELQQAFIDKINRNNGLAIIVRDSMELVEALHKAGINKR